MHITNSCLLSLLFLTVSCSAMQKETPVKEDDTSSEFKKIPLKKEYLTNPHNPIPLLLNPERIQEYFHWYEPTPGTQLPLKKHNEYSEQFEKAVIKGGQKTYDILSKKNITNYNETPKTYLQDMTAVVCFLYSQLLDKSTAESGPKKWSLLLDDQQGVWRNFFINEYLRVANNKQEYIASITTSHLVNLLRTQYGITTNIAPESIEPYFLPNNDDTILVIPHFEKKWLFLKTGQDAKTGWLKGSLRSGVNWMLSKLRKHDVVSSNDQPSYNKEYVPARIIKTMNKLFPEISTENMYMHQLYAILLKKEKDDFGKEKNEAIKSFISELEHTFDHLDIRLGNEGIFDEEELLSTSLAYSLLGFDEKHIVTNKLHLLYVPIITALQKLKQFIFLHNHGSDKKYTLQDIRNTVNEVIALKSELANAISNSSVELYCISCIDLLKLIVQSKNSDEYLCSWPLFELKTHKHLTEQLMQEMTIRPSTPIESLLVRKDPVQELE